MDIQTSRINPIGIGFGAIMAFLASVCAWAALRLPGTTGGSGSPWEDVMLWGAILMASSCAFLMTMLGFGRRIRISIYPAAVGMLIGLGLMLLAIIRRADELGIPLL